MSAPHFTVLTQQELTIDLSRPAMALIAGAMPKQRWVKKLQNSAKRVESKPETGNLDLIGG